MTKVNTLLKGLEAIAPWVAAGGSGAAIGSSVAADRKDGAMRGALIGLGSLAGAKFGKKFSDKALNKIFKGKLADAETYLKIRKEKGVKAAVDWAYKHGHRDDIKKYDDILFKGGFVRAGLDYTGPIAATAATAYAMKNGLGPKKQ